MFCRFEFESIKFKSFRLLTPGIRNFSLTGNVIETENCNVIDINNAADSCSINIKIGTLRIGKKYTDYAVDEPDYWYPIAVGYLTNSLVNIEIDNAFIEETDNFLLRAYQLENSSINVHIGNLTQQVGAFNTYRSYPRAALSMELLGNNRISYDIDNADTESPFGANMVVTGSNNTIKLHANQYVTKNKRYSEGPFAIIISHGIAEASETSVNNLVVVSGTYIAENGSCLLLNQGVPSGPELNSNIKFLFDQCIFKSLADTACKMKGNTDNNNKYYFRNCAFISTGSYLDLYSSDGAAHTITSLGGNTCDLGPDSFFTILGLPFALDPAFKF